MFTGIDHICVVTGDLNRTIRAWSDGFNVEPWNVYEYDRSNMSVRVCGAVGDFVMRVALTSIGSSSRFEVIQPLDEHSPYSESLRRHDGANHVHHIRLEVADFNAAVMHLDGQGFDRSLEATFPGRVASSYLEANYFDTEASLGFVLELTRATPEFSIPEPVAVFPATE